MTVTCNDMSRYALHGYKYFTSATTADVTFTLARVPGSSGLSLFVVKLRDEKGKLNKMLVHRLKDKLGTKYALPLSTY